MRGKKTKLLANGVDLLLGGNKIKLKIKWKIVIEWWIYAQVETQTKLRNALGFSWANWVICTVHMCIFSIEMKFSLQIKIWQQQKNQMQR